MHSNEPAIRKYTEVKSFSAEIPSWIELARPKAFFDYFQDKFVDMDVMLIWDEAPSNFKDFEFARTKSGNALKEIMSQALKPW